MKKILLSVVVMFAMVSFTMAQGHPGQKHHHRHHHRAHHRPHHK